jgi:cytochrome c553
MKQLILAATLLLAPAVAMASADDVPTWAFFVPDANHVQMKEPAGPRTVPGSIKHYTQAQINDLKNPPDWFPASHAPMPAVVAGGGQGFACASCHLVSGMGHPHNASLAGLSAPYLERQIAEFKSGARNNPIKVSGKPQVNSLQYMVEIAASLSPKDAKAAAAYFAGLKPLPWVKVVETQTVPKTYVSADFMRVPAPGHAREPLGMRIVELPQDLEREVMRDPRTGTVAYVPPGSVRRGKALVAAAAAPCATCHGADLKGVGDIPSIRGRSPIYVFRQLYLFQSGSRNGAIAPLMKQTVASLSRPDMIDLAAYLGSLAP